MTHQKSIVLRAIERGRKLHPGSDGLLDALRREFAELEAAIHDGEHIKEEALDVAVVAMRIFEEGHSGEYAPTAITALGLEIERLKNKLKDLVEQ